MWQSCPVLLGFLYILIDEQISCTNLKAVPFPQPSQCGHVLMYLTCSLLTGSWVTDFTNRAVPDFTASCSWELPCHKGMYCVRCTSLVSEITWSWTAWWNYFLMRTSVLLVWAQDQVWVWGCPALTVPPFFQGKEQLNLFSGNNRVMLVRGAWMTQVPDWQTWTLLCLTSMALIHLSIDLLTGNTGPRLGPQVSAVVEVMMGTWGKGHMGRVGQSSRDQEREWAPHSNLFPLLF